MGSYFGEKLLDVVEREELVAGELILGDEEALRGEEILFESLSG